MREETGNDKFVYEISCDQMCGAGHTGMRGVIIVETQEEYDQWLATQKPKYLTAMEAANPAPAVAKTDSTTASLTAAINEAKKDSAVAAK